MAGNPLNNRRNVFIIAEAGVNHNGSLEMALEMVDAAHLAGADAIKFQTFKAEDLAVATAPMAEYQKVSKSGTSQVDMLKKLELAHEFHQPLIDRCKQKGIMFMSTPFDRPSVKFLASLGVEIIKIPSGEITNYPYLVDIAKYNHPIIMSTGMAEIKEVQMAMDVLTQHGMRKEDIILLLATSAYPTPLKDVNLKSMLALAENFGVKVGLSDHTPGVEAAMAAVALGAVVVEKHFTLDKTMPGPDHQASLDVAELTTLVRGIRNVELVLGSALKICAPSEAVNIQVARKSIVASKAIRKGEVFSDENITTKRPAGGLSPMAWPKVIGSVAQRDFAMDEKIEVKGL
jgi:N,N'-diacetyllegionaminate synthase